MKPLKNIISIFKQRKSNRIQRENSWMEELNRLGFNKVTFPIIIKDNFDLQVVSELKDFARDPDIFYQKFDNNVQLIDHEMKIWTWRYDLINKTNLPNELIKSLTFEKLKELLSYQLDESKQGEELTEFLYKIPTIDGLIEFISGKIK